MSSSPGVLPHVTAGRTRLGRPAREVARLPHLSVPGLPVWGVVLAALLIFSRRPDAVLHAQFWAEDGSIFFSDVYRHGLLSTLLVPQSGYFQEFPVLVAGIESLVPLHLAPLAGNLVAILVRSLPVGLLLCDRARTITPSPWTRALLAGLFICLPGVAETDANVVNSLWYLAIAAMIVLAAAPARNRPEKVLDGVILCLCASTGVFAIAIAPLLWLFRRWKGRAAVAPWVLALFTGAAAVQLFALGYLQHHLPEGYEAAPRVALPLHATLPGLFEIVGRRVVMQPFGFETASVSALAVQLLGLLGVIAAAAAVRRGTPEVRLFLLFAGALLAMALVHPYRVDWPQMAAPVVSGRYFLIPEYAVAVIAVWYAGGTNVPARRAAILILGAVWLIAVPAKWSYPTPADRGFNAQALAFERAATGTQMFFRLDPPVQPAGVQPWSMTLVRH